MTPTRPKYPKRDGNDRLLTRLLKSINYRYRGLPLAVWDTSPLHGEVLDKLLWYGRLGLAIDFKIPGSEHDLTPGQKAFIARDVGIVGIVTNEAELLALLDYVYPLAFEAERYFGERA